MNNLHMTFDKDIKKVEFKHNRSETVIKVISKENGKGAVVQFFDEDSSMASVEITSNESFKEFSLMLNGVKGKHHREVIGTHFDNVVLSISTTNWGEPFEEAIEFDFEVADAERPYIGESIQVCLENYNVKWLLAEIETTLKA